MSYRSKKFKFKTCAFFLALALCLEPTVPLYAILTPPSTSDTSSSPMTDPTVPRPNSEVTFVNRAEPSDTPISNPEPMIGMPENFKTDGESPVIEPIQMEVDQGRFVSVPLPSIDQLGRGVAYRLEVPWTDNDKGALLLVPGLFGGGILYFQAANNFTGEITSSLVVSTRPTFQAAAEFISIVPVTIRVRSVAPLPDQNPTNPSDSPISNPEPTADPTIPPPNLSSEENSSEDGPISVLETEPEVPTLTNVASRPLQDFLTGERKLYIQNSRFDRYEVTNINLTYYCPANGITNASQQFGCQLRFERVSTSNPNGERLESTLSLRRSTWPAEIAPEEVVNIDELRHQLLFSSDDDAELTVGDTPIKTLLVKYDDNKAITSIDFRDAEGNVLLTMNFEPGSPNATITNPNPPESPEESGETNPEPPQEPTEESADYLLTLTNSVDDAIDIFPEDLEVTSSLIDNLGAVWQELVRSVQGFFEPPSAPPVTNLTDAVRGLEDILTHIMRNGGIGDQASRLEQIINAIPSMMDPDGDEEHFAMVRRADMLAEQIGIYADSDFGQDSQIGWLHWFRNRTPTDQIPEGIHNLSNQISQTNTNLRSVDARISEQISNLHRTWFLRSYLYKGNDTGWNEIYQDFEQAIKVLEEERSDIIFNFTIGNIRSGIEALIAEENITIPGSDPDGTRVTLTRSFRRAYLQGSLNLLSRAAGEFGQTAPTPAELNELWNRVLRAYEISVQEGKPIPDYEVQLMIQLMNLMNAMSLPPTPDNPISISIPNPEGGPAIRGNLVIGNEGWRRIGNSQWTFVGSTVNFLSNDENFMLAADPMGRSIVTRENSDGTRETLSFDARTAWIRQVSKPVDAATVAGAAAILEYFGINNSGVSQAASLAGEHTVYFRDGRFETYANGRLVSGISEAKQQNGTHIGWQVHLQALTDAKNNPQERNRIALELANAIVAKFFPNKPHLITPFYLFLLDEIVNDPISLDGSISSSQDQRLLIRDDGTFEIKDTVIKNFQYYTLPDGTMVPDGLTCPNCLPVEHTASVNRFRRGHIQTPGEATLVIYNPQYTNSDNQPIDPNTGSTSLTSTPIYIFPKTEYLSTGTRFIHYQRTEVWRPDNFVRAFFSNMERRFVWETEIDQWIGESSNRSAEWRALPNRITKYVGPWLSVSGTANIAVAMREFHEMPGIWSLGIGPLLGLVEAGVDRYLINSIYRTGEGLAGNYLPLPEETAAALRLDADLRLWRAHYHTPTDRAREQARELAQGQAAFLSGSLQLQLDQFELEELRFRVLRDQRGDLWRSMLAQAGLTEQAFNSLGGLQASNLQHQFIQAVNQTEAQMLDAMTEYILTGQLPTALWAVSQSMNSITGNDFAAWAEWLGWGTVGVGVYAAEIYVRMGPLLLGIGGLGAATRGLFVEGASLVRLGAGYATLGAHHAVASYLTASLIAGSAVDINNLFSAIQNGDTQAALQAIGSLSTNSLLLAHQHFESRELRRHANEIARATGELQEVQRASRGLRESAPQLQREQLAIRERELVDKIQQEAAALGIPARERPAEQPANPSSNGGTRTSTGIPLLQRILVFLSGHSLVPLDSTVGSSSGVGTSPVTSTSRGNVARAGSYLILGRPRHNQVLEAFIETPAENGNPRRLQRIQVRPQGEGRPLLITDRNGRPLTRRNSQGEEVPMTLAEGESHRINITNRNAANDGVSVGDPLVDQNFITLRYETGGRVVIENQTFADGRNISARAFVPVAPSQTMTTATFLQGGATTRIRKPQPGQPHRFIAEASDGALRIFELHQNGGRLMVRGLEGTHARDIENFLRFRATTSGDEITVTNLTGRPIITGEPLTRVVRPAVVLNGGRGPDPQPVEIGTVHRLITNGQTIYMKVEAIEEAIKLTYQDARGGPLTEAQVHALGIHPRILDDGRIRIENRTPQELRIERLRLGETIPEPLSIEEALANSTVDPNAETLGPIRSEEVVPVAPPSPSIPPAPAGEPVPPSRWRPVERFISVWRWIMDRWNGVVELKDGGNYIVTSTEKPTYWVPADGAMRTIQLVVKEGNTVIYTLQVEVTNNNGTITMRAAGAEGTPGRNTIRQVTENTFYITGFLSNETLRAVLDGQGRIRFERVPAERRTPERPETPPAQSEQAILLEERSPNNFSGIEANTHVAMPADGDPVYFEARASTTFTISDGTNSVIVRTRLESDGSLSINPVRLDGVDVSLVPRQGGSYDLVVRSQRENITVQSNRTNSGYHPQSELLLPQDNPRPGNRSSADGPLRLMEGGSSQQNPYRLRQGQALTLNDILGGESSRNQDIYVDLGGGKVLKLRRTPAEVDNPDIPDNLRAEVGTILPNGSFRGDGGQTSSALVQLGRTIDVVGSNENASSENGKVIVSGDAHSNLRLRITTTEDGRVVIEPTNLPSSTLRGSSTSPDGQTPVPGERISNSPPTRTPAAEQSSRPANTIIDSARNIPVPLPIPLGPTSNPYQDALASTGNYLPPGVVSDVPHVPYAYVSGPVGSYFDPLRSSSNYSPTNQDTYRPTFSRNYISEPDAPSYRDPYLQQNPDSNTASTHVTNSTPINQITRADYLGLPSTLIAARSTPPSGTNILAPILDDPENLATDSLPIALYDPFFRHDFNFWNPTAFFTQNLPPKLNPEIDDEAPRPDPLSHSLALLAGESDVPRWVSGLLGLSDAPSSPEEISSGTFVTPLNSHNVFSS